MKLSIKWKIILGITMTSIISTIIAVTIITEIEKKALAKKSLEIAKQSLV